jgi:F-type H+-transporting ATPase subunit epsilon
MSESEVKRFAQGEGYLQVHSNHALVLVEECLDPARIDVGAQREQLEKAQAVIDGADGGEGEESVRLDHAIRDKRRAETFLRIAGESSD